MENRRVILRNDAAGFFGVKRFGMEVRLKNKPNGLFFNWQFCVEAQNCCDRRGEITCVISPRGRGVRRFGMKEK